MTESARYNRPRLTWISSGLGLLAIGSVAMGLFMLVKSEWGATSHPVYSTWFLGGMVTIAVGLLGVGVGLLGWHVFAQREAVVTESHLLVRRWLNGLLGLADDTFTLDSSLSARFFVKSGGAKLALDGPGVSKTFSIWFWPLNDARGLARKLAQSGASVRWELPDQSDVGQT